MCVLSLLLLIYFVKILLKGLEMYCLHNLIYTITLDKGIRLTRSERLDKVVCVIATIEKKIEDLSERKWFSKIHF